MRKRLALHAERALRAASSAVRRLPAPRPLLRPLDRAASRLEHDAKSAHRSARKRHALGGTAELRTLANVRLAHLETVDQPLVLISQVHRSGGTLLLRLLDGHPQLRVMPHELGPALPAREVPLDPARAWDVLYDVKLPGRFRRGLKQARRELNEDAARIPFLLPPSVHRWLFDAIVRAQPPRSGRDVLDAYYTAYFNAWLDDASLGGAKRWLVGFEPGALANPRQLGRFREHYPDGRTISLVREPASWVVSARRWSPRFARLDIALELWSESTRGAVRLAEDQPERSAVVDFDDLVLRTDETMRRLARFLGIDFLPTLLTPTLNGTPVRPNSSFPAADHGVTAAPTRRSESLTSAEQRLVEETAGELYRRATAFSSNGDRGSSDSA